MQNLVFYPLHQTVQRLFFATLLLCCFTQISCMDQEKSRTVKMCCGLGAELQKKIKKKYIQCVDQQECKDRCIISSKLDEIHTRYVQPLKTISNDLYITADESFEALFSDAITFILMCNTPNFIWAYNPNRDARCIYNCKAFNAYIKLIDRYNALLVATKKTIDINQEIEKELQLLEKYQDAALSPMITIKKDLLKRNNETIQHNTALLLALRDRLRKKNIIQTNNDTLDPVVSLQTFDPKTFLTTINDAIVCLQVAIVSKHKNYLRNLLANDPVVQTLLTAYDTLGIEVAKKNNTCVIEYPKKDLLESPKETKIIASTQKLLESLINKQN